MQKLPKIWFRKVNDVEVTKKFDLYKALRDKYYQFAGIKENLSSSELNELQSDKIIINVEPDGAPIPSMRNFVYDRLSGKIKDKYVNDMLEIEKQAEYKECFWDHEHIYDLYCKENIKFTTKTFDYKKLKVKDCRGASYILEDDVTLCGYSTCQYDTCEHKYNADIVFYRDGCYCSSDNISYQYDSNHNSIVVSIGSFVWGWHDTYHLQSDRPYVEFSEE